jgi:hypothetical protein
MSGVEACVEVVRSGTVDVALPPAAALDLFTAEGETHWVPGWSPRYLHPADGTPVAGGIWLTHDRLPTGDVEVIWRVQRFDRARGIVEHLRVVPGHRVAVVRVRCEPAARTTRAHVTYRVTPLSDAGRAWLDAFDETAYAAMLAEWQRLIDAYLARSPQAA